MNKIIIDNSKCISCGKCVDICGANALEMKNKIVNLAFAEMCNSCGHCAAICPENVIISNPENLNNPFIIKDIPANLPPEQLLFHKKRSVREFKSKVVEKENISKLIEYAEKAPSSSNIRKRKYYVITNNDEIAKMETEVINAFKKLSRIVNPALIKIISIFNKKAGKRFSGLLKSFKKMFVDYENNKQPVFRKSTCVICIAAPTKNEQSKDDCIISQQYMMLFGQTIGLGSCIIGYAQYQHKIMEKILKVPKGYSIYAVSVFGMPKYIYEKEIDFRQNDVTWIY